MAVFQPCLPTGNGLWVQGNLLPQSPGPEFPPGTPQPAFRNCEGLFCLILPSMDVTSNASVSRHKHRGLEASVACEALTEVEESGVGNRLG